MRLARDRKGSVFWRLIPVVIPMLKGVMDIIEARPDDVKH